MGDGSSKRMTRGQWAVHRERAQIDERRQPPRPSGDDTLEETLPKLMKKLGLDSKHWVETLSEEWSSIVGEAVSKHTRPGRIDGARLTVFVDSSAWLSELKRFGKKEMQQNLQKRFGIKRIREIRLQLDPDKGR
jgi:predicted nucleic acid-binding Zn ribbon protein